MTPPPFSRIQRNTGWVTQNVPFRCTFRTLSHAASVALAKLWSSRMPALLTRISARPKCLMASSNTDWPPAMVEISAPLAMARPPSALIASTTFCAIETSPPEPSRGPPRSLTTTAAPSRANRLASASPRPPPAPVISAALPSSNPIVSSPLCIIGATDVAAGGRLSPQERGEGAGRRLGASSSQQCPSALDDGDVAGLHLGFKRDDVAVLPKIHGHGLPGIDRGRE